MSADDGIATLPYITVQHDFSSVLADARDGVIEAEDFWVSCYRAGAQSVHGKVNASRNGLVPRAGLEFARDEATSVRLAA